MISLLRRRSERDAFMEQAMPHVDSIYRVALRDSGNPSVAQDLVQETFKEAWKSFKTFERGSNCRAWLFKIFFRVSRKHRSDDHSYQQVALEKVSDHSLSVPPDLDQRLEHEAILKILESLPDKYRTVLVLADIEELSYREISVSLDIPMGTVMSRLNRARGLFREKFRNQAGENWKSA